MKVFIVHAHHEPKSFNGALTDAAVQALTETGHEVRVSDLYRMEFDPISDRRNFTTVCEPHYLKQQAEESHAAMYDGFAPDIKAELDKLDWCDVLIFQFPLWWFGLPAILKGWVDRVLAMGQVYGGGLWFDRGYFKGKRAMLSLTTGGGPGAFSENGLVGDIQSHLHPINYGILRFVGFDVLPAFIAWGPARASEERRRSNIDEYVARVLSISETEPIVYRSLEDYDPKTLRRREPELPS